MAKKIIFAFCIFGGLALVLFFLAGTKALQFKKMAEVGKNMQPPPESVSTAIVQRQVWTNSLQAIGSIEPVKGVRLDAEVPGIVNAINFENGQDVNAGDVLVELDTAPEAALLKSNKANARLARIELDRARRLRDTNSVAQSELDRAQANYDMAMAQVKNIEAIIEQKTIRAPFDGRVGIRQINLGQYLSPGAPIVTLQSYDNVFANFTLPQQAIGRIETGMPVTLKSNAYPEKIFSGRLTAISPQIDPTTRTIELQATLANPEKLLRAGLFVNVTITLSENNEVLAIPATAIIYAPYGNSIFKITRQTEETTGEVTTIVKQSFIQIGERKGDFVSVLKGLKENDEIVSAGALKLRNGMPVSIKNEMAPSPKLHPTPENS